MNRLFSKTIATSTLALTLASMPIEGFASDLTPEDCPFTGIPSEILRNIFSFTDLVTQANTVLVSKQFHKASRNHELAANFIKTTLNYTSWINIDNLYEYADSGLTPQTFLQDISDLKSNMPKKPLLRDLREIKNPYVQVLAAKHHDILFSKNDIPAYYDRDQIKDLDTLSLEETKKLIHNS